MYPDGFVPINTILVCRSFDNPSHFTRAASVMLLDTWNLSEVDCVVPVAHRGRTSRYDFINETRSRSSVHCMVHCSQFLLESDWPMPSCSEGLGLFFGSPKTEPQHSLFAAAWDITPPSFDLPRDSQTNTNTWIQGDSFECMPVSLHHQYKFILMGFVKQKLDAWQVHFSLVCFAVIHLIIRLTSRSFVPLSSTQAFRSPLHFNLSILQSLLSCSRYQL